MPKRKVISLTLRPKQDRFTLELACIRRKDALLVQFRDPEHGFRPWSKDDPLELTLDGKAGIFEARLEGAVKSATDYRAWGFSVNDETGDFSPWRTVANGTELRLPVPKQVVAIRFVVLATCSRPGQPVLFLDPIFTLPKPIGMGTGISAYP